MTEDEAKTKWCPLTFGRGADLPPGPCVGSDCMAFVKRNVLYPKAPHQMVEDCHCGLMQQVW